MQLIEYSGFGLRAARHVLTAPDRPVTVTLFCMVHIGEAGFFDQVAKDAAAHDMVLIEGVDAPVVRRITRSYRWIAGQRLGLVVQPPARKHLIGANLVHADLDAEAFQKLWQGIPLWQRAGIEIGAFVVGITRRLFATRSSLGAGLALNDGPSRETALSWSPERAALIDTIMTARDRYLVQELRRVLGEVGGAQKRIAVVYGAGHMPAVTNALGQDGFRVIQSDWIKVFDPG